MVCDVSASSFFFVLFEQAYGLQAFPNLFELAHLKYPLEFLLQFFQFGHYDAQ
jgi:uncharacterized membrane protein YhdT